MSYVATDVASVVTAVSTSFLVLTAIVAARYAKQDITTQRETSRKEIEAHINTSADAIKAGQEDARRAQEQAERELEAHIKVSAEAITTSQDNSRRAQEQAERALESRIQMSAEAIKASQANARRSQELAKQDIEVHVESSEEALQATYRPLLIDVHEHTSNNSDLDPDNWPDLHFHDQQGNRLDTIPKADWRRVHVAFTDDRIHVAVPLRNVGTGPAVVDIDGISLVGRGDPIGRDIHRERVPRGETTRLMCTHELARGDREQLTELHLTALYRDLIEGNPTNIDVLLHLDDDGWHVRSIHVIGRMQHAQAG
jgi:hypothetical protein